MTACNDCGWPDQCQQGTCHREQAKADRRAVLALFSGRLAVPGGQGFVSSRRDLIAGMAGLPDARASAAIDVLVTDTILTERSLPGGGKIITVAGDQAHQVIAIMLGGEAHFRFQVGAQP